MLQALKVSIIGTGNVGVHLCRWFMQCNIEVLELYNRTAANAQEALSICTKAKFIDELDLSESKANFIFITVSDKAIEQVVAELKVSQSAMVLHSSGATNIDVLNRFNYFGVFYPIQTFSKNKTLDYAHINVALEANSHNSYHSILLLVQALGCKTSKLNSDDRLTIHLSAVFACNFTNALLNIANDILKDKKLALEIIKPLVDETIHKAFIASSPKEVQTGPAIRNDKDTINQHLSMLSNKPEYANIYRIFTEHIQKKFA